MQFFTNSMFFGAKVELTVRKGEGFTHSHSTTPSVICYVLAIFVTVVYSVSLMVGRDLDRISAYISPNPMISDLLITKEYFLPSIDIKQLSPTPSIYDFDIH